MLLEEQYVQQFHKIDSWVDFYTQVHLIRTEGPIKTHQYLQT